MVDAVKKNICGKVTPELVRRRLGVHRFHHPGHEDTEGVGEAKFIHLWQETNGTWKVTRVISFDHHGVAK